MLLMRAGGTAAAGSKISLPQIPHILSRLATLC
jgi:hypothetical protein